MNELNISEQVSKQINDSLGGVLETAVPVSLAITAVILALWIVSAIRKWMVERAIFEIRNQLREMNGKNSSSSQKPEKID